MHKLAKRGAALSAGLIVLGSAAALLGAEESASTTAAGVYSEAQAERGKANYAQYCQNCHGDDMEGIDMAPPLVGESFLSDWVGQNLGDLADRVRTTMPQNNPSSLSSATAIDIISQILKANGYPAGNAELPKNAQQLQMIRIVSPKSAG